MSFSHTFDKVTFSRLGPSKHHGMEHGSGIGYERTARNSGTMTTANSIPDVVVGSRSYTKSNGAIVLVLVLSRNADSEDRGCGFPMTVVCSCLRIVK